MALKPNPLAVLTTDAQIAVWNSEGLPDDRVSVENGCIVTNTARWPLLIDPQLQGITWVRQREAANGLIVVRLEQKDMLRKLEAAIEKGAPVLIENMGERIDAVLSPVIARALIKKGSRFYVKLGEKELEFNPKFRLYLHTKLSNPHYPPEVQAEACLVNFTVTEAGLEDQMLTVTVAQERPDLLVDDRAEPLVFRPVRRIAEVAVAHLEALAEVRVLPDDVVQAGAKPSASHYGRGGFAWVEVEVLPGARQFKAGGVVAGGKIGREVFKKDTLVFLAKLHFHSTAVSQGGNELAWA
jgi:hypothetical protein